MHITYKNSATLLCAASHDGNSAAAYLSQVIQIQPVVGRAKGHEIAVSGAELHAAHIGLAVNGGHSILISNAPQPDCAIITATHKSCGVSLHQRGR